MVIEKHIRLLLSVIASFLFLTGSANSFQQLLNGGLYASKPKLVKWKNDQEFSYIYNGTIYQSNLDAQTKTLISIDSLSIISGVNCNRLYNYKWESSSVAQIIADSSVFWFNFEKLKVSASVQLPRTADSIYTQNGKTAFTYNNTLYIKDSVGKKETVFIGEKGKYPGAIPYRQEFGCSAGCFWSPSGRYLAFYLVDRSQFDLYPLTDFSTIPATVKTIRYPFAGGNIGKTKVGIYDSEKGKTIFLKTEETHKEYFTNIAWSPNEKQLYTFALNRGQDSVSLYAFNSKNGKLESELIPESTETYVEPENPVYFINDDEFYFLSERNGFNHLYKYSKKGNSIEQLTDGQWEITGFLGFSDDKKFCFFSGTDSQSHRNQFVYRLNIANGNYQKISDRIGYHSSSPNPSGTASVNYLSSTEKYAEITINAIEGEKSKVLFDKPQPKDSIAYPGVEFFSLPTADSSFTMQCRLLKPSDFDKTRKYPLILYVYNGPHIQLIKNKWMGGAGSTEQLLAASGYLVLSVDGRGSYGNGFAFESTIHRQNGIPQLADQLQAIEYISSLPYVDTAKIGVHGWSFGGYMTVNLMLNSEGIFKAGIAGAPVIDWSLYEVMYGERYMDTPAENPEGYEKCNLIDQAKNLKGKLLIINGGMDDVVVPQHSMLFLQACTKANTAVEYFYYPPHDHHVRGRDRLHLIYKMIKYFDDNLKNCTPSKETE